MCQKPLFMIVYIRFVFKFHVLWMCIYHNYNVSLDGVWTHNLDEIIDNWHEKYSYEYVMYFALNYARLCASHTHTHTYDMTHTHALHVDEIHVTRLPRAHLHPCCSVSARLCNHYFAGNSDNQQRIYFTFELPTRWMLITSPCNIYSVVVKSTNTCGVCGRVPSAMCDCRLWQCVWWSLRTSAGNWKTRVWSGGRWETKKRIIYVGAWWRHHTRTRNNTSHPRWHKTSPTLRTVFNASQTCLNIIFKAQDSFPFHTKYNKYN